MTEVNEYILGTVVTVYGEWDVNDVPTDPTTISLIVQDPAGVETTHVFPASPITRTSAGRYEADIQPPADQPGLWKYRWDGTGLATGGSEGQFYMQPGLGGTDVYTYDPATPVGEVRLYIDDRDLTYVTSANPRRRTAIFTDAEIGVFLTRTSTTLGAGALALITIASNKALLVQRRTIGKTDVDFGSLRADLLKSAEALQKAETLIGVNLMAPADGYAEHAWTDAGARDIHWNSLLREDN